MDEVGKGLEPVRLFHSPRDMCAHKPFSELAEGNCAGLDAFYKPKKKKELFTMAPRGKVKKEYFVCNSIEVPVGIIGPKT